MNEIQKFCQENGIAQQPVESFLSWFQGRAAANPEIIEWLKVDRDACIKKAFQEYDKQMREMFAKLQDKNSPEYKKLLKEVYEECKKKGAAQK